VVEVEGKPQVIVSATKRVRGYDLATGRQLWECAGLTDNVVSSPVYWRGLVIAGNSYYSQAMLAIRLAGAKGDISNSTNVAWRLNRLTPYVSSPLLYDDSLYHVRHNQNILVRLDPATGEIRQLLRLDGIRDFIFSSPVGAASRIYVTGRDGTTVVLKNDHENTMLAVNHLNDSFSASAALVDNEVYLRGEQFLYCISEGLKTMSKDALIREWTSLPSTDRFVRDLAERAKITVDLPLARTWAINLPLRNKREELVASEIPQTLRNMEPTAGAFGRIERRPDGSSAVFIEWGGGFGHWGLAFTTNRAVLANWRIVTEVVTDDVYAFATVDSPTEQSPK
jgi:hypothetical protein